MNELIRGWWLAGVQVFFRRDNTQSHVLYSNISDNVSYSYSTNLSWQQHPPFFQNKMSVVIPESRRLFWPLWFIFLLLLYILTLFIINWYYETLKSYLVSCNKPLKQHIFDRLFTYRGTSRNYVSVLHLAWGLILISGYSGLMLCWSLISSQSTSTTLTDLMFYSRRLHSTGLWADSPHALCYLCYLLVHSSYALGVAACCLVLTQDISHCELSCIYIIFHPPTICLCFNSESFISAVGC